MLSLALLFGGVLLVGLAADVTRLVVAWREVSFLAQTAAEAGAGWVQPDGLYRGEVIVDEEEAAAAAGAVAAGPGRTVDVTAAPTEVCVTVARQVAPGLTRLVGGARKTVAVTACAGPRQG